MATHTLTFVGSGNNNIIIAILYKYMLSQLQLHFLKSKLRLIMNGFVFNGPVHSYYIRNKCNKCNKCICASVTINKCLTFII